MTPTSLSGCSASYRQKLLKMASVFLKEEKICYKMVYYTLLSQSSEITKSEFTQTKKGLGT